ncbi:hypothetical protein RB595_009759 [Gaeumannomyces hyphopodioides]
MSDSAASAAQASAPDAQPSGAQVVQDPPAADSEAKVDDAADTKVTAATSVDDEHKEGDKKSAEAKDAPTAPTEEGDAKKKEVSDAAPDADTAATADESAPTGAGAKTEDAAPDAATDDGEAAKEPTTPADKSKARRKSTSVTDSRKKLNRKGSRAKILHIDAKPGDYFFIRLKGYPLWPGIICDEDMLPQTLLKTRPVTAARPDGTYREDFADGGKRAADRTFPVMYLFTNEFGWIPNQDLVDLDTSTVASLASGKMRKDLQAAHELAGEGHDLQYFKDLLIKHQEDILNEEKQAQEQQAARAEAKAAAAARKAKKTAKEDEDVEMADADEDDMGTPAKEKKHSKKRKAEDDAATPQRSDSVKKPKIKLTTNSTPKAANGTSTPKSPKPAAEAKASKSKAKKPAKEVAETKKTVEKKVAEKEKEIVMPELSPEEKHARKEKEVLFLRHKLQKGLLTRDQEPKEDEMKAMSDYIEKLEVMPELEVSIIRATKINKVLKAILKLDNIPKEDEYKFKPRSKELLDKWTKLLAEGGSAPAAKVVVSNGVNGATTESKTGDKDTAVKSETGTNGVKANGDKKAETPIATEPANADVSKVKEEADEKPEVTESVEAAA